MILKIVKILRDIFDVISTILFCVYRDVLGLYLVLRSDRKLSQSIRDKEATHKVFRRNVKKHPNKPCIVFHDRVWTFQMMEDYSNKIANLFLNKFKLKKGECVALFMENRPEYVGTWLGLSKIGVITALINTNLKTQPLAHSIKIAKAKAVIYNSELEESIEGVVDELGKEMIFVNDGAKPKVKGAYLMESLLKDTSDEIVECPEGVNSDDVILYIYTSGTTGLPKPAVIKQSRYYGAGFSFWDIGKLTKDDICYVCLPIYHGNGGLIGIGLSLICGSTIVLRKKFSASAFWKDCVDNKCTIFVYVGEICRFLVNQPPSALDRTHGVRKAFGNGLRLNVWNEFSQRFNIKCVEFYAASEGNCITANIVSKIGACGFLPLFHYLIKIPKNFIIKIDDEMNPIRDKNGFCIECKRGEPGLMIGIIGNNPRTAYNGYANNKEASNKKIIENVFKKGERAFNSGDLLMCDRYGYLYFCDRLGDTYRWRGENVSTIEVENVISSLLDSKEVLVYGVQVPGQEGRAGMAAIVESADLDLVKLSDKIKTALPSYARPVFIRLIKQIEHTGSFKAKKTHLVDDNFDITRTSDKIYYFDPKDQAYKLLAKDMFEKIKNASVRL